MSQNLKNINKYVFADLESEFAKEDASELIEQLENPRVAQQVHRLYHVLADYSGFIREMSVMTGTTLFDASLAKIANDPPRFEAGATADDVRRAVKHFAGIIKKTDEIASHVLRYTT